MVIGSGSTDRYLDTKELGEIVERAVETIPVKAKRVLVIIPDGTRTMPMPTMFSLLLKFLRPRVQALDYLVALGTHPHMTDAQLTALVGHPVLNGKSGEAHVFNHHWESPETFVRVGTIPASEIKEITRGMLSEDVP